MRVPHPLGRRGFVAVAAVLLAAAAAGGWLVFRPTSSAAQAQQITYTVMPRTVQQTVSATGTLAAAKQADLDFAVSGTVTHVYAKLGDHVTKGQALARIDDATLRADDNSAQAALSAANAAYVADVDGGAGSTQLASDTAQIASANAALSQATADLAHATLRSPISGVVASRDLSVGDTVSGGASASSRSSTSSSSGSGSLGGSIGATSAAPTGASAGSSSTSSTAFTVIQPGRFKVVTDVSADDVGSVTKGMQVQLTTNSSSGSSGGSGFGGFGGFAGFAGAATGGQGRGSTGPGSFGSGTTGGPAAASSSDSTIFGTVTSVAMIADTSSPSAGFPVTINVTGAHTKLYAGTSVTASIITKQINNVLAVPAMALSSSNGKTYVEKVLGDKAVKTAVAVGQTFGSQTQITRGLSSGDTIRLATGFTRTPTTSHNGGAGGRGGFPGGGFPGGGFPAGGGLPSFGNNQ